MPRPIWKGFLSFGLVTVPCSLASMEEPEKDIDLSMLDRRDNARIRYLRVNEKTGKEVPWGEIVKGHQLPGNKYVIVTPQDLRRAAPKATRTIEIIGFVNQADIAPWYYLRPYVVQPLEGGEKGYRLLGEALADSGQVGVATVVLHTRQHIAALIPSGNTLVLNTMRFDSELRPLKQFGVASAVAHTKANSREVDMALMLLNSMSTKWHPEEYHDEYRDALRKWILAQAKRGGKAAPEPEEEEELPETYNIMEMLKKSIEGKRPQRALTSKKSTRRKAG